MSGAATTSERDERWWQVPRLDSPERLLGGVASGIADELGVDPMFVRVSFVVLAAVGGWGLLLYGLCWIWFSVKRHPEPRPRQRPKGASRNHRHAALMCATGGFALLVRTLGLGFADALVWPVAALGLGFAVIWHQSTAHEDVGATTPLEALGIGERRDRAALIRVIGGLVLAVGGLSASFALSFDLEAARDVIIAIGILLVGLGLLLGPWIYRLVNDLTEERRRRIRSEERTDLAAHLHDSVLQTLALIQRHSDDTSKMVGLARRQERELRAWLYGDPDAEAGRFRGLIEEMAAEVEDLHGVPVEVVVVGDAEADDGVLALIRAAREATANAARHSGADRVDVFAEADDISFEVFVRDTGRGFDPSAVAEDRRGLADSIQGRMTRHGGSATVTSEIGEGTEIELNLPRERQ